MTTPIYIWKEWDNLLFAKSWDNTWSDWAYEGDFQKCIQDIIDWVSKEKGTIYIFSGDYKGVSVILRKDVSLHIDAGVTNFSYTKESGSGIVVDKRKKSIHMENISNNIAGDYYAKVYNDGTYIYGVRADGSEIDSGTLGVDDVKVLKSVRDALPSRPAIVAVTGDVTIDSDFTVDYQQIWDFTQAQINLSAVFRITNTGPALKTTPTTVLRGEWTVNSGGVVEFNDAVFCKFLDFTMKTNASGVTCLKYTNSDSFTAHQEAKGKIDLVDDNAVGLLMEAGNPNDGNVGMRSDTDILVAAYATGNIAFKTASTNGTTVRNACMRLVFFGNNDAQGLYLDGDMRNTTLITTGELHDTSNLLVTTSNGESPKLFDHGIAVTDDAYKIDNAGGIVIEGGHPTRHKKSVEIGTGGAYGSGTYIWPHSQSVGWFRIGFDVGGTFATGETVTLESRTLYHVAEDITDKTVEKDVTSTGRVWLSTDEIYQLLQFDYPFPSLRFRAKTTEASTDVTVDVIVVITAQPAIPSI